ncbi:MAG: mechanosensitive ion channel protein MscS, partial [Flavobacteriaceae bacterium]
MVKILGMLLQEDSKFEEVLTEDIWESISSFLNQGLHIGTGDKSINITIGLLLALVLAFIVANLLLKWLRYFFTRNLTGDHKLKFFNVFRFIKYFIYLAVVLLTMSAAGIDITLLITASAVLFVGLGLALQDLFQDVIGGIY